MAAEGEFAFVIAVFSVDSGLISEKLYASVVLAILISTVIPPFALRFTISYYNRRAEKMIEKIANDEMERNHLLEGEETLAQQIQLKRAVFLCIQTQSLGRWGLMHELMSTMAKLGLDVIDHRAWREFLCASNMSGVHLASHSLSSFFRSKRYRYNIGE
jgi:hypothetical protein